MPPVLYCTSDGGLCRTGGTSTAYMSNNGYDSMNVAELQPEQEAGRLLLQETCSINSFGVERSRGADMIAATDYECLLFSHQSVEL